MSSHSAVNFCFTTLLILPDRLLRRTVLDQRADSVVYNVSDWLSDKPRDVSLLYASDRKLFNVTSASGVIRLRRDRASNRSVQSLALLADYPPPRRSVVLLVCLKMAAEDGTQPLPTSGYRAITAHVSQLTVVLEEEHGNNSTSHWLKVSRPGPRLVGAIGGGWGQWLGAP